MPAIDFPNSPALNDTFSNAGKNWIYNGYAWSLVGLSTVGNAVQFASGVFSGSSSSDLLRITQTGAGNALVVEDSANPDSTPFVITASGNIGQGISSPTTTNFAGGFVTTNSNAYAPQLVIQNTTTDVNAAYLILEKSRTSGAVVSGDRLGTLYYRGHDGTNYVGVAEITSLVDGAISANIVPGRLVFNTASSAGILTERMRIDSNGQVGIGATPAAGRTLTITKNMTGASAVFGLLNNGVIQSDATAEASYYRTGSNTAAASFTVPALYHFFATQGSIGAGSSVTTQAGFVVSGNLTGASNNIAFYGDISSAAGRWNLYMQGTAANYLAGRLGVGALLTSGAMAQVTNTTAADKAFVVKGAASQAGALLELQNSAGTVLAYVAADGSSSFYEGDQNILAASIFS